MIWLVTTDGRRECIERTLASARDRVEIPAGPRIVWDDSGDEDYRRWLGERLPDFEVMGPKRRLGQDYTLQAAWAHLAALDGEWVFHLEDDFTFEREVDLGDLVAVLEPRPHLAQMALLRQPWFAGEVNAGGVLQRDPGAYEQVEADGQRWLEHRLWFTLNPCVYRRSLCEHRRPVGRRHEWRFSRDLCKDPAVRFGIWGSGEQYVTHIGHERRGKGY